jgi:hypothetical protein
MRCRRFWRPLYPCVIDRVKDFRMTISVQDDD